MTATYTDFVVNANAVSLWHSANGNRITLRLDSITSVTIKRAKAHAGVTGDEYIDASTITIVYGGACSHEARFVDGSDPGAVELDECLSDALLFGVTEESPDLERGYDVSELASFVREIADDVNVDDEDPAVTLSRLVHDARNIMGYIEPNGPHGESPRGVN